MRSGHSPIAVARWSKQAGADANPHNRPGKSARAQAPAPVKLGWPIVLLRGDHTNQDGVGLAIVRTKYDEGVRAIFDIMLTSVTLGGQNLTRKNDRIMLLTSTASTDFTGANYSPNCIPGP